MHWQPTQSAALKRFVGYPRLGLIADLDGTLSPITGRPDQAQITPKNMELMERLQRQLTLVAVLSGRSAADIRSRVGIPGITYIGNHGLERWQRGRISVLPAAQAFRARLESALADLQPHQVPGMILEDKGATISIHYRQTRNPSEVFERLLPVIQEIAARHGLDHFQGRMVFELRPPIEVDKGSALRSLVSEHLLDSAFFLGDDTTDVAAFRMARRLRRAGRCYSFGIGVDSDETPAAVLETADLLVSGISGVESFLDWLSAARMASLT